MYKKSSDISEATRDQFPSSVKISELEYRLSQFNEKLNTYKKNRDINYSIDASTMPLDDYSSETDKDYIAADSIKYSLVTDDDLIAKLDAETENPDDYLNDPPEMVYRSTKDVDSSVLLMLYFMTASSDTTGVSSTRSSVSALLLLLTPISLDDKIPTSRDCPCLSGDTLC